MVLRLRCGMVSPESYYIYIRETETMFMGSVKDLETETQPTPNQLGEGLFKFTDSYSIFDWGRMPDRIDDKGRSLCTMGAFNFELLESEDIPTHYRGVVEDGEIKELDDATQPPKEMAIYLAHKPDLPYEDGSYDYQAFHRETGDTYLIPLEVVFRNSIPPESSFRNRKTPGDIGLNIDRWPDGNCELPNPVVEYSTKLEDKDRYLTIDEARKISGLGDELEKVRKVADRVNQVVTEYAQESGFIHVDGKIECVYHKGDVLVADVVGTFDENRYRRSTSESSTEATTNSGSRESREPRDKPTNVTSKTGVHSAT